MSTLPVQRTQTPFPACNLVRHEVGRRVQFTRWNHSRRFMEIVAGEVLSHVDRTVTVLTPWGEQVWTSCGHVVAEVRRR